MELEAIAMSAINKRDLMRVFKIIEEFRKIYPDMQMQTAGVFVTIAMNEGITIKDLGSRCDLAQSTCSRNVSLVSDKLRFDKQGYGLVEAMEDPMERRRKIITLTPKGKRVASSLCGIVETQE